MNDKIFQALRSVMDPELHVNIVDLGLVYKVTVKDKMALITMTLTTPGCPMAPVFEMMIKEVVKKVPGITDAKVILTFDPPWEPSRMAPEAKTALGF